MAKFFWKCIKKRVIVKMELFCKSNFTLKAESLATVSHISACMDVCLAKNHCEYVPIKYFVSDNFVFCLVVCYVNQIKKILFSYVVNNMKYCKAPH